MGLLETAFHPDYGFPNEVRAKVIQDALDKGLSEAAKTHRIAPQTIKGWIKRLTQ
jgi:transposase-like protein